MPVIISQGSVVTLGSSAMTLSEMHSWDAQWKNADKT